MAMAHSSSPEPKPDKPSAPLLAADRQTLLQVARTAISHSLTACSSLLIDPRDFSAPLQAQRAVFVTLKINGELRGCIGNIEPPDSLIQAVARNANAAAFDDPRFAPLTVAEFQRISIHLSILTPPEPMDVKNEQDLLKQLRPGVDGLILTAGLNRGTFLPAVWQTLPEPQRFVEQLKIKAGLPADFWSDDIRFQRYQSESVE